MSRHPVGRQIHPCRPRLPIRPHHDGAVTKIRSAVNIFEKGTVRGNYSIKPYLFYVLPNGREVVAMLPFGNVMKTGFSNSVVMTDYVDEFLLMYKS